MKIKQNNLNENKADLPQVKIMPPTIFLICLILGGVFEFLLPSRFILENSLFKIFSIGLGAILGISGFVCMMVAHETFKKMGTNVPLNLPATLLVEKGLYCISRNPMYLGMLFFFLGMALGVCSLWILGGVIIFFVYLNFYVIPREERYLKRIFDQTYSDYCKRVRRWI